MTGFASLSTLRGRLRAVIFDLDGTLTEPLLDFDAIRQDLGVEGPILEAIEGMDAERARDARTRLERHEELAARNATLRPGAREILEALRARGLRVAILTRNHRRALDTVAASFGLEVDARRSREDGRPKPHPEPVLALCETVGARPEETLVVGDFRHDLESARAAGAWACLIRASDPVLRERSRPWEHLADFAIERLEELRAVFPPA